MKKDILVIEPQGGLGNRITVLHSSIELAKDINAKKIMILWLKNDECGCDFDDLFDGLDYQYSVISFNLGWGRYKDLLNQHDFFRIANKLLCNLRYSFWHIIFKRNAIDTSQNVITSEQRTEYQKKLKGKYHYAQTYRDFYGRYSCDGVIFNSKIVDAADIVCKNNPNYVAMHIRRTDNALSIKTSPTELFEAKVQELLSKDNKCRIYLATDDTKLYRKQKKLYPYNIIDRNVQLNRGDVSGMKDALLELLICAKAHKLYGSANSSFSMIAHLYGQNDFEILQI